MTWRRFPCYWPFLRGIHRESSPSQWTSNTETLCFKRAINLIWRGHSCVSWYLWITVRMRLYDKADTRGINFFNMIQGSLCSPVVSSTVHTCVCIYQRHKCCQHRISLQWRYNEHDGVSNHQRLYCLPNCLFRHRSKKTSKLRVTGDRWIPRTKGQ